MAADYADPQGIRSQRFVDRHICCTDDLYVDDARPGLGAGDVGGAGDGGDTFDRA
jgi:hypothetical protein